jgi:PleD family two-component response regulator
VVLETGWALALRGNGLAVVMLELGRHGPSGSLLTPEAAEHAVEALGVLVADDDEATLRATRRMLERFGCVDTAVSTSREALGRVTGSETIDLLVTDIVMPEMGGFTLVDIATRHAKSSWTGAGSTSIPTSWRR